MVGDVEAKGLFLPLQTLAVVFLDVWKLGPWRRELGGIEHRELVLVRTFRASRRPFDSLRVNCDHRGPRGADVVECAALYEGFQSPLVVRLGVDALAEVEDALEGPFLLPGGDYRIDARVSDVLDGGEPETDGLPDHRKAAPALVHVGREDLYLHRPGLSDVLGHPIFGVHHAAHEGRHIGLGIVGLEVGGLKRKERVARAVALVEGVSSCLLHPVPQLLGAVRRDAARSATCHELVPECGEHRRILLAYGLAQRVGLARSKSPHRLGDLHQLLLVGGDAVGRLQDRLQSLVKVLDALWVVLAALEVGDVVHRARSVKRVQRDEVIEAVGPDLLEHPLHPARLELEDPESISPGKEFQSLLVVERDRTDVGFLAAAPADGLEGLFDHIEVPQAEEIHLEQSQRLHVGHGMLDHDGPLVPGDALQRHYVGERLLRDDDASGVGPRVAGETLYLEGSVEDLLGSLILPHELDDLARRTRVFVSGNVGTVLGAQHVAERGPDRLVWDELGEFVRVGVGVLVDSSRVPDGRLRADGPERDDLGDVLVAAVLVRYVAHHLRAPRDREVYVHIRHVDTVWVQKALEEQRVLQGIEVRYLQRVGDDGAGSGSSSGSDRDLPVLRILDEIPHDQEVVSEAHLRYGLQLELKPAEHLPALRPSTVTPREAAFALLPQILVGCVPFWLREVRKSCLAELDPDVFNALDDFDRVLQRLRVMREEHRHLFSGLDVELLPAELHAVLIVVELAGPDAQQHVVHPGIVSRGVVGVVGSDDVQSGLLVQPYQPFVHAPLIRYLQVILHLEVDGVEDLRVLQYQPARFLRTPLQYPGRHLCRKTAGEADDPTPILSQHLHVDPRLVVEALKKPAGGELHEVPVAFSGPGDEREVVVRCAAPVVPVGRDIDLAAHQGLYASVFCLLVKLDRAIHHTVVRKREPWHPLVLRKRDEVPYTARPVEHRILRVTVQVRESAARRNRQPSSLYSRVSATPRKERRRSPVLPVNTRRGPL